LTCEVSDRPLRQKLEVLTEVRDRAVELGLATPRAWLRDSSARVARPATSVISAMRRAGVRLPEAESLVPAVRDAIAAAGNAGMLLTPDTEVGDWGDDDYRYFERLVQVHQELVACLASLEMELRRRATRPRSS